MPSSGKVNIIDYDLLSEIDHEYEVCIGLTLREIAALYQQVEYLGWRTRYDNPPDDTKILYEFAEGIQYKLLNAEGCDPANVCVEYPATAPFVEWIPAIGEPIEGSTVPAWTVGDISLPGPLETLKDILNTLLGLLPGDTTIGTLFTGMESTDVVTTLGNFSEQFLQEALDRLQIDLIPPEYPEFRVHVSGTGVCELHFVSVPLGSTIVWSLDRPINRIEIGLGVFDFLLPDWLELPMEFVDTNRDILQVPPETSVPVITEIEITEDGDHTIYCMVLPRIDIALAPDTITFGGGLRKIELCGNLCPQGVDCRNEENLPIMTAADVTQGLKDFFCGCGCAGSGGSDDGTVDGLPPEADLDGDGEITEIERETYDRSRFTGQIYRLMYEMEQFRQRLTTFYASSPTDALLKRFIESTIGTQSGADSFIPKFKFYADANNGNYTGLPADIDKFAEVIFCRSTISKQSLNEAAFETLSASTDNLLNLIDQIDLYSDQQIAEWSALGFEQPRDDWLAYKCWFRRSSTIVLDVIGGAGNAEAQTQEVRYLGENRVYEIRASGSATLADGSVIDPLYIVDPEGDASERFIRVGLGNSAANIVIPSQTLFDPESDQYPEYSPSHTYSWTVTIDYNLASSFPFFSAEENNDEAYDDGLAASFTYTIIDRGQGL